MMGLVQWLGAELELRLHYFTRSHVHYTPIAMAMLSVQDSVKAKSVLRDTLDTVQEMTKLIKKSPKREAIFHKVKDDIACESPGIRLLCPTRWTVRAAALGSISEITCF